MHSVFQVQILCTEKTLFIFINLFLVLLAPGAFTVLFFETFGLPLKVQYLKLCDHIGGG